MNTDDLLNEVQKKALSVKPNKDKKETDQSFNNVMDSISLNWEGVSIEEKASRLESLLEKERERNKQIATENDMALKEIEENKAKISSLEKSVEDLKEKLNSNTLKLSKSKPLERDYRKYVSVFKSWDVHNFVFLEIVSTRASGSKLVPLKTSDFPMSRQALQMARCFFRDAIGCVNFEYVDNPDGGRSIYGYSWDEKKFLKWVSDNSN